MKITGTTNMKTPAQRIRSLVPKLTIAVLRPRSQVPRLIQIMGTKIKIGSTNINITSTKIKITSAKINITRTKLKISSTKIFTGKKKIDMTFDTLLGKRPLA